MDINDFLNDDLKYMPKELPIENEKIEITIPQTQEVFCEMATTPSVEENTPSMFVYQGQENQNFDMPFVPKYITKLPTYSPEQTFYQQNPDEE